MMIRRRHNPHFIPCFLTTILVATSLLLAIPGEKSEATSYSRPITIPLISSESDAFVKGVVTQITGDWDITYHMEIEEIYFDHKGLLSVGNSIDIPKDLTASAPKFLLNRSYIVYLEWHDQFNNFSIPYGEEGVFDLDNAGRVFRARNSELGRGKYIADIVDGFPTSGAKRNKYKAKLGRKTVRSNGLTSTSYTADERRKKWLLEHDFPPPLTARQFAIKAMESASKGVNPALEGTGGGRAMEYVPSE